jgi:hypothetical protein
VLRQLRIAPRERGRSALLPAASHRKHAPVIRNPALPCPRAQIYFQLSEATDVVGALKESAAIVQSYVDGRVALDEQMLEGARSGLVFAQLSGEETAIDAARDQKKVFFAGLDPDYNARLVAAINTVTREEVEQALRTHVSRLFPAAGAAAGPHTHTLAAAVPKAKQADIRSAVQDMGYRVVETGPLERCFTDSSLPLGSG